MVFLEKSRMGLFVIRDDDCSLDAYLFLITPETQLYSPEGAGIVLLTGVCGLDGHSQAPMDGFTAYREKDNHRAVPFAQH